MALDTDTLVLVHLCISVIVTWLLVAAAWSPDALRAQRLWAAGNVLLCAGIVIGADEGLPLWIHGAFSYGLCGLGIGLLLRGLYVFCGLDFRLRWVLAIGAVTCLVPLYYCLVEPDILARRVVSGLLFGVLNLYCAHVLLRHLHDEARKAILSSVTGFGVLCVVLLLRAWYWSSAGNLPASLGPLATEQFHKNFYLLIVPMTQVAIAFGLIAMVARRHSARLTQLSLTDHLTGLYNRSVLQRIGERIATRARHARGELAVAMVDADHFKRINDAYGHTAGDEVLRHLAQTLSAALRPGDLVLRYGGEEFLLVLDGAAPAVAARIAERIRAAIEADSLSAEGYAIRYTVSIGVAGAEGSEYDLHKLIAAADARLYAAKRAGRNRICTAD